MKKEIQDFLKEINDGKVYNAQKKLADMLSVDSAAVSKWCSGKALPSLDNISKMAKIFKKSEKEIKNIFSTEGKNLDTSDFADVKDVEILKEKTNRHDTEIDYLKDKIKNLEDKFKMLEKKIK